MIKSYYRHRREKINVRNVSRLFFRNFIRRKILIISLIALLIILPFSYMVFKNKSSVEAAWMDDAYAYRQTVAIANTSGSLQTNFQVAFTLNTLALINANKMQNNCNDIRVTDMSGKILPYWFSGCNTTTTQIWPKIPSIPTSGTTVYVYYGNTNAPAGKTIVGTQTYPGLSCKSILDAGNSTGIGIYWIDPTNGNTSDKFQAYCDMTNDSGGWMLVTPSMINSQSNTATSTTQTTDGNGGLILSTIITTPPTSCGGNHTYQVLFSDIVPWTQIKADYEFTGAASCWSVFGNTTYGGGANLIPFASATDTIRNQVRMGGSTGGDNFDGINTRCDNVTINFWHANNGTSARSAQVILRRNSMVSLAGLGAGSNCNSATTDWKYQNIYVRENSMTISTVTAASPINEEKSPAPVTYLKFDEGQGVTANDSVWKKTGTTTNLITNPSFEVDTSGWGSSGVTLTAANAMRSTMGSKYASVVGTGSGTYPHISYTFSSLAIGTYSLQFRYKADAATATNGYFYMWATSPSLADLGAGGVFTNTGVTDANGWVTVKKTFTVSSGQSNFQLWLYLNGNATATSTLLLDGIQVETGATANLYCDGAQTGNGSHVWNGAANASTSTCDNGTDGQVIGATWQNEDQCISGKCVSFDGVSSYVDGGNASQLNMGTGDFSFEGWAKLINDASNYGNIVGKASWNAAKGYGIVVDYNSQNCIRGYLSNTGVGDRKTTNSYCPTDNTWHHYAVTYTRSGNMIFYVDGVQQAVTDISSYSAIDFTNTTSLKIGVYDSWYSKGSIDDIKVYAYARTAAQIKTDFASKGSGSVKGTSVQMGSASKNSDALSNGLVGYWKMDESSWGSVIDASGNGNTGSVTGGATPAAGRFGNGGNFDGSTQNISIPDNSTLNPTTAITVSAWYKTTDSAGGIIVKRSSSNGYRLVYAGNTLYFTVGNGSGIVQPSTAGYNDGTWHFVVGTWSNSDNTARLYIDGILKNSGTLSGPLANTATALLIGDSDDQGKLIGSIDEARIYSRALSASEISTLYAWAPGPIGYWNFEEGSGASTYDLSGNGYNGINTGTTVGVGKYGKARSFNGSSDFISVPDTTNLRFGTNNFTVEGWIKFPISGSSSWEGIITKGYTTSAPANTWGLIRNNTNTNSVTFQDSIDAGGSWNANMTSATFSNGWHHIAVTRSGTSYSLYSDGISTSGTYAVTNLSTTAAIKMGSDASPRYFNGSVDEVKIYNYARSSKQITEDMNGGHPAGGSPVGSQIGYFKFDEGHDSAAYNSGSQTTTASINGATWSNDGKFGKSLTWSGSNLVSSTLNYNSSKTFTISAYIKPTATGTFQDIIGTSMGNNMDSGIILNTNDICYHDYSTSSSDYNICSTTASVQLNQWQYVALTYDNGTINLYYNGKNIKNGSFTKTDTAAGIIIGGNTSLLTGRTFTGNIDEVKIYNTALSAADIALDYNRGSALVMGSATTSSSGVVDNSSTGKYCIPGDASACSAPVAEWNFEEGINNNAYDTSGNGNIGTLTNSPSWTNGKIGKGLAFSGTQYVSTPDTSSLQLTSAGSLEAWVNPSSYPAAGLWSIIAYKGNWGGGRNEYSIYYQQSDSSLRFEIGGATANQPVTVSNTLTPLNTWSHVTLTWDGSFVRGYINGSQVGTPLAQTQTPNTSTIIGGIGGQGSTNGVLTGKIDAVKIYNYARTPAQVAYDYNRGAPVGWWKFDECQGTIANDSSGNGFSGTVAIGTTAPQTSAGTCTDGLGTSAWNNGKSGKYNASLNFDGVDDYVSTTYTPPNIHSISAWFKTSDYIGNRGIISTFASGTYNGIYLSAGSFTFSNCTTGKQLHIWTNGNTCTDINSTFANSTWYNITVTSDGSTVKVYVNGIFTNSINTATTHAAPLFIGRSRFDTDYWDGQIDDVRVYNYALTATQVKTLYNGGTAVQFGP